MKIIEKNNSLILENVQDLDLKQTFDCGQCFRWSFSEGSWRGIAFSKPLRISQSNDTITLCGASLSDWNNIWKDYFDIDRDYSKIKSELAKDDIMRSAVDFGRGIRILNQEPFECLISFIISASNNIPRIKKIISLLCENFGEKVLLEDEVYYAFPTPEKLASLTLDDLSVIKAGFRDKYILGAAKCVASGMIDLECLKNASYDYAKSELLKLSGVGKKVCECVLLFSLRKKSGFPVDVWIKRIMEYCYFNSEQTNDAISEYAKNKFGDLGGFAQQYLFYWARENKIGI